MGDRRVPLPDRRRNCDRCDRSGDRRTGRGRWLLPVLLLPVRVLHLRLLLVLPVPRPLLGRGRVGLARLPDVRTVPLQAGRRGRNPSAAVRERRDHQGSVRPDDAGHRTEPRAPPVSERPARQRGDGGQAATMENRGPAFATTAPSGTELSAVVTSGVAWVPSASNAPHIAIARPPRELTVTRCRISGCVKATVTKPPSSAAATLS